MRERKLFIVAREHSKSPEEVRNWSDYDVEKAWFYYVTNADSKEEFTPDDAKQARERIKMAAKPGYVLDLDYSHWQKFITDGELDPEKLKKGNYTSEQTEYIQDEMNKLGWLGGDAADTQPLDAES